MNAEQKIKQRTQKPRAPLFNSPWLALFLILRHEWLQLWPNDK